MNIRKEEERKKSREKQEFTLKEKVGRGTRGLKENIEEGQNEGKWDG
jgi:hypothetical protein